MPSLSERLKSLGVQVGAQNIPTPTPRNPYSIDKVLDGRILETPQGETYLVEARYLGGYQHGKIPLRLDAPLQAIAAWAGEQRIFDIPDCSFAFIDTETTGLQGGTGTYAFLIGVGRFEGEDFHLSQFFMRDPVEEPAQLAAVEEFVAPCQALVTFNGKAFDLPLLTTRFITHGWRSPFTGNPHFDLLHLARRLWSDRLPNRSLGSLEVNVLGARRTEDDIPGWLIPSLYFDYLRDGDARPLKRVFYHNAIDVISMVALFNHMAGLLHDPFGGRVEHPVDLVALGRLYEAQGDIDRAIHAYQHALEHDLPLASQLEAVERLAAIHKHQERFLEAVSLWVQAARQHHLEAHVELAKYYEHRLRDYAEALRWVEGAIQETLDPGFPSFERRRWLEALEHRRARLLRKLKGGDDGSRDPQVPQA